jgi:hypothetical protein
MIDVNLPPATLVANAHVAELVDAADSKSAVRKGVKVRFLSWAQASSQQGAFLFPPLAIHNSHKKNSILVNM